MLLLRRIMAITLLASFAGSQPAAASCAMASDVDEATAPAAAEPMHVHHSVDGPAADSPAASESGSDPVHGMPHSGQGTSCGLMMACAAAAPAAVARSVPAALFMAETSLPVPDAAHTSPSLAFEPPPPRQILI